VRQGRLVRESSRHRCVAAGRLLVDEGQVTTVLLFLAVDLRLHGVGPVTLGGEEAHEDLVADGRRPAGAAGEPGAQCPLAARGQPEVSTPARAVRLVPPRDEPAPLEVTQQLVDLPDVRMPEWPETRIEELHQLIAVGLPLREQCQQRVA
jgi:hypothetical protein